MAGRTPYPQEMKERAVRMVGEVRGNYGNEYTAIKAVAARPYARHHNGGTLEGGSHHHTQTDMCSITQTGRKITRLTGGQPQN